VALGDAEISIGRDLSNQLPIDDPSVSRRHCSIRKLTAEQFEICDLGSKNGTTVNGLPIEKRVLEDGDEISLGDCRFLFMLTESSDAANPVSIQLEGPDTETSVTLRRAGRPKLDALLEDAAARARVSDSLAVLVKISSGIHAARGTEEIVRLLLERIFEAIPADRGTVLVFEGLRDEPVLAY
jgi:pSer/pThr/pTyr-binding forkhead associated (FHA) protein